MEGIIIFQFLQKPMKAHFFSFYFLFLKWYLWLHRVLRRGFFQAYFHNKAKNVQNFIFFRLGSYIAAFFIFQHQKIYPKVSAESVIRTPRPLLVRTVFQMTMTVLPVWKFINKITIVDKKIRSIKRTFVSVC